MSIKIEHRNLEIRKTRNDFSVQVRNLLLPLSLKVLRHKERDTHSFYSGFFICTPLLRHRPKASASKQKSTLLVRCPVLNPTHWPFQNPPRERFRCMTSFTSTGYPFNRIFISTYLNDTSSPHARQHQCSSLHLTKPYAEPKGSQPN